MHTLIIGRTKSGKSALAKMLGSNLRASGYEVLAFNPIGERGYTRVDDFGCQAASWESDNPERFVSEVINRLSQKRKRFLIIDECHEFFSRGSDANTWLGTKGRHYGLNCILISQRGALINPTIRSQCGTLYLFMCSLTDAKFLADEYGNVKLARATTLKPKEFFKVSENSLTFSKLP